MSSELLQKLEEKVDTTIETIELLRLQIEELEDRKEKLIGENTKLKEKQDTWEKNLNSMLDKLDVVGVSDTVIKEEKVDA